MKIKKPVKVKKSKAIQTKQESTAKNPALQALIRRINKTYGDNAITLGVKAMHENYVQDFISTGILQLDLDLGGGIPIGRYTEISGPESSTKTTLTMNIIAEAQRRGIPCAFCDVEHTSDEEYMRECGVDPDNLLYFTPASLEEATNIIKDLQVDGYIKLCAYDSIAASLATIQELEKKDIGESMQLGNPQQMIQSMLRRHVMINNRFIRTGQMPFTLIGINQLRDKIGVTYGDPSYTPGGRAKDFMSSLNLRLRQGDWIKEGQSFVGQVVKYKVSKNKLFKRQRSGEVDFYFEENSAGVEPLHYDTMKDTVIVALGYNLIDKAGGWFSYKDLKVQGMENFAAELLNREDLMGSIRKEVMQIVEKTRRKK